MNARSSLLFSAVVALAVCMPAQGSAQEDGIRSAVHDFHAGLAEGDSAKALAQLSPEVRIIEGGRIQTLEEYRSHHLPGDMAFAAAVTRESSELSVRIEGDVAWVYSTSTTEGEYRGREINSRGAELAVLVRSGGTWRIVALQWS
jgi:ketosteroid isomerase-like protein